MTNEFSLKSKILGNKKSLSAIALLLIMTFSVVAIALPTASAHTPPWQIPTFAFVQAVPNPVGVGQTAYVFMWVDKIPDGALFGNDIRLHNYNLTIVAPDGAVTTKIFAVVSDTTSNQGYVFTPTKPGTYTLYFNFPGQISTNPKGSFINDTYQASSASTTLTVQQEPIVEYPTHPLPTQYWTRPIYGENSNWWIISSNWLGSPSGTNQGYGSDFPGDAVGPQTGHVMWTKPLQSGGVVGGNHFVIQGDTYFEGSAYNNRYTNPIILDGKLYYTEPVSFAGATKGPTDCVDLRTGKLIWSRTDVPALAFGYIYDIQDINQKGVYPPILFSQSGRTWRAFDADTGTPMFNVTNTPSGTSAIGVNGEYLIYVLANAGSSTAPQYYLRQWNSSNLWYGQYNGASTSPSLIPPITDGGDTRLNDWNVSIPSSGNLPASTLLVAFPNNMVLCRSGSYPAGPGSFGSPSWSPYTYFAINLNKSKGAIGSILWKETYNAPADNISVTYSGADLTAGVFVEYYKETIQFVGYSLATGQQIWGPLGDHVALNYYSQGYNAGGNEAGAACAYGKLYLGGFGGLLYCYDLTNGNLLWTYGNGGAGNSTSSGFQVPGNYPAAIYAIGNGIVYTTVTEHTVNTPIYKGGLARAINATDGTEVWTLSSVTEESGGPGTGAIADGFSTFLNGYDNQIYVVGRGPSATTVEAPKTALDLGRSLIFSGTVMDISAGTKQDQQAADFPNGVPAASGAIMKDWMGYVYQQQPLPANATGVQVKLTAVDSNGNSHDVGTATSDTNGKYGIAWVPPIVGMYYVKAEFLGTESYWGSQDSAYFVVDAAPSIIPIATPTATPTAAPTATPTPTASPSVVSPPPGGGLGTEYYVAIAAVVIIIAIAAVAVVLRRRK